MKAAPIAPSRSTVLIAGDIADHRNLLGQMLESKGYDVLLVPSGEIALQVASRGNPDLILLDIIMPGGIDGLETCRRLKQDTLTQNIPVIFITGKDDTESVVSGFEVGGVDYITKPFAEAEVLIRVQTHLKISL